MILRSKYTNCNYCEYYIGGFKCVRKAILILITLPITVVTFGFFLIVINAITLKIADSLLGDAFNISGFGVAIVAAICISILI